MIKRDGKIIKCEKCSKNATFEMITEDGCQARCDKHNKRKIDVSFVDVDKRAILLSEKYDNLWDKAMWYLYYADIFIGPIPLIRLAIILSITNLIINQ